MAAETEDEILVHVHSVAGDRRVALRLPRAASAPRLKQHLRELLALPFCRQRLLHGAAELSEGQALGALAPEEGPLELTLVAMPHGHLHSPELLQAAEAGCVPLVWRALFSQADPDCLNPDGRTALFLAAQGGHEGAAALLIEAEADVDKVRMESGATPLYMAAHEGHADLVRILTRARADTEKARNDGATPLFIGSQYGNLEVTRMLCLARAEVNRAAQAGGTPLYVAAQNGHEEVADYLCSSRADCNQAARCAWAPLHIAAQTGRPAVVRLLLASRAEADATTVDGRTASFVAATSGHAEVLEALLQVRADVNRRTSAGAAPLLLAAQQGHTDSVRLLCGSGAALNLAEPGAGVTPLVLAAQNGHLEVVELLCGLRADVDQAARYGITPLYVASAAGHLPVVVLLCQARADPTLVRFYEGEDHDDGVLPAEIAAQSRHEEVARYLEDWVRAGRRERGEGEPASGAAGAAVHGRQPCCCFAVFGVWKLLRSLRPLEAVRGAP